MCELFGVCAKEKFRVNELLSAFYQHSKYHRDGWGLAVFRGQGAFVEKEPIKATDSAYLKRRMSHPIEESNLFAHIRFATIGRMDYCNCHPFMLEDQSGRNWTMIHNGTFFNGARLARFLDVQEGTTDSERLIMYIVESMNDAITEKGRPLDFGERFRILDEIICELAEGNKINMLLHDGEYMYVHTNCRKSLHRWTGEKRVIFATRPVTLEGWEQLPINQLLAYREGELTAEGTVHDGEFQDADHDYLALMSAYSEL